LKQTLHHPLTDLGLERFLGGLAQDQSEDLSRKAIRLQSSLAQAAKSESPAAVARALARDGWNIVTTFWRPYDASMPWGSHAREAETLIVELKRLGVRAAMHEDNLEDPDSAARIFDAAEKPDGIGARARQLRMLTRPAAD